MFLRLILLSILCVTHNAAHALIPLIDAGCVAWFCACCLVVSVGVLKRLD